MKKLSLLGTIFFSFLSLSLAQLNDTQQKTVSIFEGFPPIPFEAPDINGQRHFLPDYKDKVLILFFWNLTCEDCKAYLGMMNELATEFKGSDFQIISLADEEKQVLSEFTANSLVNFPIIPNGKGLGEMGYAIELGYPRAFLIDKFGIIQKVVTGSNENFYGELKLSIETHLKK
jgi:thiol-disulfide isomerase/thioredoxin